MAAAVPEHIAFIDKGLSLGSKDHAQKALASVELSVVAFDIGKKMSALESAISRSEASAR